MRLEDAYNAAVFGRDEPDVMWIPYPLGAVMITKDGHFLCDDDGNIVGEVERNYAEEWFRRMEVA